MWQRWLSLPVFLTKVSLAVFPTLLTLSLPGIRQYGALFLSLVFVIIVGSLFKITNTSPLHKLSLLGVAVPAESPLPPLFAPPDPVAPWLALYQLQPQHRDILINLGHTLTNQGRAGEAVPYLEAAQALDPNFNQVLAQ